MYLVIHKIVLRFSKGIVEKNTLAFSFYNKIYYQYKSKLFKTPDINTHIHVHFSVFGSFFGFTNEYTMKKEELLL